MFPTIYLKKFYLLVPLSCACLLACSKQQDTEVNTTTVVNNVEKKTMFVPEGKWLVTHNLCEGTIKPNELEAITLTKNSVKMGNVAFTGKWTQATEKNLHSMSTFIDKSLPDCSTLKVSDFKVGTYISNETQISFAVSEDQNIAIRLHNNKYSFATPFSKEAIKRAISVDPFEDEPLPYDPFENETLVEKALEDKDVDRTENAIEN
tara:strand:+ start:110 stop:727 length:618 start_codon:yes stop_codon:yes gene_type:complete